MTKIAVLVGSLSQASINKKLAEQIAERAPEGVELVMADMDLPLFNYELEADLPEKVRQLKSLVESADGVLFITPEYNRGYTAIIKNAIDWASRPYGTNSFHGKPAAITGASSSSLGTAQAQQQLRNVVIKLETTLMTYPEMYIDASRVFTEEGALTEGAEDIIQGFIDAVVAHVQKG